MSKRTWTIIVAFAIAALAFSGVLMLRRTDSYVKFPLVLVACIAGGVGITSLRDDRSNRARPDFIGDPLNRHEVRVRGWSEAELTGVLRAFAKLYGLDAGAAFKVSSTSTDALAITFPHDLEPTLVLFLINYLQYPADFELRGRSVAALAHVDLTSGFEPTDSSLMGQRAEIYVPRDDRDHDLVYVRVPSGRAYAVSFADFKWRPVDDPRLPDAIADL